MIDKKRSILNVIISIVFKVVLLVCSLLVRRYLIQFAGNDVNGLNSLYISIIGFLSVAELGVGAAISFCMYKPIVEGNKDKVSALYGLFKKLYIIIGGVILLAGLAITPAIPFFAKDYNEISVDIYLTFILMLISTVATYAFSAKVSLINAYKNNYLTTTANSFGLLIQYAFQVLVLFLTHSFVWYLVCRIGSVFVEWIIIEIITRKKYKDIISNKQKADSETKKEVGKNVKAIFMHKIGALLVNTTDSILISLFVGVVLLGKYTNYTIIMTSMIGVISLCFTPLTSIIGHLCVNGDSKEVEKYFNFFYAFNYILGCVFFLGYYGVIDNLVTLCFGDNLELTKLISFVITLNYFIQFMEQATRLFKDASGTFYRDRWKCIFEGVINLGLSILCVYLFQYFFGEEYAVIGVIVPTIITNLAICHTVEPHVLYKYVFTSSTKKYFIKNYSYIALFAFMLVGLNYCLISSGNQWYELIINGCIAVAISLIPCILITAIDKDFRYYLFKIVSKFKNKFKRHKTLDA